MARHQPWAVWEEDILWWNPYRQRWQPPEAESLPRRRRWLIVETEEGFAAALTWDVDDALMLPATVSSLGEENRIFTEILSPMSRNALKG